MPEACLADGFRFATCVWEIDDFKSPSTLDCSTISFRMCYLVFCRVLSGYYISLCSPLLYFHNLLYSSQQQKGKSRNPCVRPHLKSCNVRNTYYRYEQSSCGQMRIYGCKICSAGVCLSSRALYQACDLRLLYPLSEPNCCQHGSAPIFSVQKKRQRLWNLESTCARRGLNENLQLHINIQHRDSSVSRRRRRRRPVKAVALPPRRRAVV